MPSRSIKWTSANRMRHMARVGARHKWDTQGQVPLRAIRLAHEPLPVIAYRAAVTETTHLYRHASGVTVTLPRVRFLEDFLK